nr:MAG TPA: hypothetical protein [Caudoviricetes sp.]
MCTKKFPNFFSILSSSHHLVASSHPIPATILPPYCHILAKSPTIC